MSSILRPVLAGAAAVVMLSATSACSGSSGSSGSSGTGDKAADGEGCGTVAVAADQNNSTVAILITALNDEAKKQGCKVLQSTNANGDAAKQAADIQNLIAAGAKGIVVMPVDGKAVIPSLEYAKSKGVKVVAVLDAPSGGPAAMVVTDDFDQSGAQACDAMGKGLDGKGTVISMAGDQSTAVGVARTKSFADCMAKSYPAIKVLTTQGSWDPSVSATQLQTKMTENPNVDGIYAQSDSIMLPGVLAQLKRVGKDARAGQPGHVFVVSIDGSAAALDAIRQGRMDVALASQIHEMGDLGISYLKDAMAGKTFEPGPTDHESTVVDDGGVLHDPLPLTPVTKQNVDDETLMGNQAKN